MPSSRMNIVPADHAQGVSTLAASKARGPVRACGRRGRHGSPCHRVRGDGRAAYAALRARCAAARRHTAAVPRPPRRSRGGAAAHESGAAAGRRHAADDACAHAPHKCRSARAGARRPPRALPPSLTPLRCPRRITGLMSERARDRSITGRLGPSQKKQKLQKLNSGQEPPL